MQTCAAIASECRMNPRKRYLASNANTSPRPFPSCRYYDRVVEVCEEILNDRGDEL